MIPSKITIRKAKVEDGSSLFPLAKEMATSFIVERVSFEKSLREITGEESSICLVAEDENEIVGYVIGFDHKAFYANGRVSWVEEIFVKEELRKEGIGKELMNEFEKWCVNRKSKLVGLATRRASEFYTALDYAESAIFFRKVFPQPVAGGDAAR